MDQSPKTHPPRTALIRTESGLQTAEIHTLFCVGKNYADHAREMGAEPNRAQPMIFLKPAVSLVSGSRVQFRLPAWSNEVHHEVEMVVYIGPSGIEAVGVGLDLTLRDLQSQAKSAGTPWTPAKGFPGAALLSEMLPVTGLDLGKLDLRLEIGGTVRQTGNTQDLLHGLPALMSHLAQRYGLLGGELLYTGTPAGVGPIEAGDRLLCTLAQGENVLARFEAEALPRAEQP